jgi:hypothetical protein
VIDEHRIDSQLVDSRKIQRGACSLMLCMMGAAASARTGVAPFALTLYAEPPPTYSALTTSNAMIKLVPHPESQVYVTS